MTLPLKAVYSYYLPESRRIITGLTRDYPHEVFLRGAGGGLDGFHEPVLEKLVAYHGGSVPALGTFPYRYPCSGSEEFIREFITLLKGRRLYVLEGEYEGYRELARTRGIAAVDVPLETDPRRLKPGVWMVSNPSARDGNLLSDGLIGRWADAGHEVFYDLAYLGCTPPRRFDLSHPNITAAALSFSKPYGLFYYRIGFGFSRRPLPALSANKWFKNVLSLMIAERLMDSLGPAEVARRYKAAQAAAVRALNAEHGLAARPSDAFLLAWLPGPDPAAEARLPWLKDFRRGPGYRFCLTPYFLAAEMTASAAFAHP